MNRPSITDPKAKKYVKYLENKLKEFEIGSTEVESYLALKNFISQGNTLLTKLNFSGDELSDKDDKAVERGLKFADKLLDYNQSLQELYEKIGIERIEEAKDKKKVASAYEAAMPTKK